MPDTLRFITYLAPSLPRALFRAVVREVSRATGIPSTLAFETRTSGPPRDAPDPFSTGAADVAFLCAPTYAWLVERDPPAVERLPAAPVFADLRARGRPVYYCDVIVGRDHPARAPRDLAAARWAYNDVCSLSGYHALARRLDARRVRLVESGSHLRSIRMVARGAVDAAAIDSNVLLLARRRDPTLAGRVRVVASWGPYPVQPVVARATLPSEIKERVTRALLAIDPRALAPFGVVRFAPAAEEAYADERARARA